MRGLNRILTTFVVCFVVCFVSTLVLRLGRSNTSVDRLDRSGMLSSGGDSNGWKSALDSLQTEPGYLIADPVTQTNPRRFRNQDPKLKREFDYLIYDLGKGVELKLVRIAAKGKSFVIGSPKEEVGRFNNEAQHEVTFTNDYYIGVFEVTIQQFRRFIDETGYRTDAEKQHEVHCWNDPAFLQTDLHPVDYISWNDAKKFCDWLGKKGTPRYLVRLPGEAEWEYACRAGSKSRFHFGNDPEKFPEFENVFDAAFRKAEHAEGLGIKGSDGFAYTSPVGTFKPNGFGLYDMQGNVSEWCEDTYGELSELPVQNNSIQSKPAEVRVKKGGHFSAQTDICRSAVRDSWYPRLVGGASGFRVAVVIKDE